MSLRQKLRTGSFAVLAEMEPPKGVNVSTMIDNAMKARGRVDAFVVPEMSNAVMRMSSLGGAMVLQSNGLETVMQVNCRDRNRIALQADLLAAAGCGIGNVMAVTGQDPGFGDHHQARSVYDIDLLELLNTVKSLQNGRDMAGIELDGSPDFLVGSSTIAGSRGKSNELELEELHKKVAAGVEFFITPPLFDLQDLKAFQAKLDTDKVHILPTVVLLKSLGMARYMARNMEHIHIPEELIQRIQKSADKVRECTRIAVEMVATLKREGISGVMIATIGWENKLPEILEKI